MSGSERRRLARIPLRCAVVVREKRATWTAETADVGARGCRITLARPVARGALLQLRFEHDGAEPLEAVGQVVWTRSGDQPEAGVAFVSAPRSRGGSSWIDAIAAARLRGAVREGAGAGGPGSLVDAVMRLGVLPRTPLPPVAHAVARVAEREGRISEVPGGAEGIATLAQLLADGTVTLGPAGADGQGWKRLLAAPAGAAPVKPPAAPAAGPALRAGAIPVAIVPPPPGGEAAPASVARGSPPSAPVPPPAADARASRVAAMIAESLIEGEDDAPGRDGACVA